MSFVCADTLNINVLLWSLDEQVLTPQGIFGVGRHGQLKVIRVLAELESLSVPTWGYSRLELASLVSLWALDVLWCWSNEVPHRPLGCTWGPALKEGRPLDGGGIGLVWLARGLKEHPVFREVMPPVPPGLNAGRDTCLWRRRGCSMRGQVEAADLGVTELCGGVAGALSSFCLADWASEAGQSLAFTPCEPAG